MIPDLLSSPPWENRPKQAKRKTVPDVAVHEVAPMVRWEPGERDRWLERRRPPDGVIPSIDEWDEVEPHQQINILRWHEVGDVRALAPKLSYPLNKHHKDLVAYLELAITEPVLAMASRKKEAWETPVWELAVPFGLPGLVGPVVELYSRRTKGQQFAIEWLHRHVELAATHLIPQVVGPNRKGRSAAENALRVVARHNADAVRKIGAGYGDLVAEAVEQFLDVDPLHVLPSRLPTLPSYIDASQLPAPALTADGEPLPAAVSENILIMLALSKDTEYAGIEQVKQLCEPDSLAAFALAVYTAWYDAGRNRPHSWLTTAIDHFGNDSIIDHILQEPIGKPFTADEVRLDLLGRLDSDATLTALFHLSGAMPRKVLAGRARGMVREMAEVRGLTEDQVADRLIHTFDLDDEGSTTFDFGPRSFSVVFDETLTPIIRDEDGTTRKALPKAAKSDDPSLAADANKRFKALKKNVKATASSQVKRFERAMVLGRRWTREEYERCFVTHPLMRHLVRRLVWLAFTEANSSAPIASYRIAEDGTLATASDDPFELATDAIVAVAHPIELQDLAAWTEVFVDYEIGQPFEQLHRDIYVAGEIPSNIEVGAGISLTSDPTIPYQRILGLTSRGWSNEQIGSSTGNFTRELRETPIHLPLEPGFAWGKDYQDQHLGAIRIGDEPHPVDISEVVRDLVWMSRP